MRSATLVLLALAVIGVSAGPAPAQRGAVELGFDAAISYNMIDGEGDRDDDHVIQVSLPMGGLFNPGYTPFGGMRVGVFVSETVAVEPVVALQMLGSEGETLTAFNVGVKTVFHLAADPTEPRGYFGVGPTLAFMDFGYGSRTQLGLAGELGLKTPISDRFLTRSAIGVARLMESDEMTGQTSIYLLFGFSFLTGD